jgi:hypothetical protein
MEVLDQLADRPASRLPSARSLSPLTLDFLAWVASEPRTYSETMEAWRTSCPRFPVWEDALSDGLVQLQNGDATTLNQKGVILTPQGHAILERDRTVGQGG